MATEVILPKVDMDMEEGLVSAWHVRSGEKVTKGDALFDIETDKAAMEVEAPASGTLAHVTAPEGTKVPVGRTVAWIYAEGEAIPDSLAGTDAKDGDTPQPVDRTPPTEPAAGLVPDDDDADADSGPQAPGSPAKGDERPRATPAARRAARDAGLTLASVTGTGPKGRIQADDVDRAVQAAAHEGTTKEHRLPQAIPAADKAAPPASRRGLVVTRRRGRGTGAPIMLVHGFAADGSGWAPLEKSLGDEREIIRIDLASHGRSPVFAVSGFTEFAKSVVDTFDALDVDSVHLVGHSLGAAVATMLADIRPRSIRSLGLISPAGLGAEIDGDVLTGIARASRTESLAPWLKRLTADPDAISWDFARAAMSARSDAAMRNAQHNLADTLFPDGTQSFDLAPALGRVSVPLTVIWGRNDSVIPWRHVLRAPDCAALHLLDKTGHIPHIERPEACARALRALFTIAET